MAARKTVSVVFCDIVGSTTLGEQIDPEVHRRIQERYFDGVRAALERHGGTVEKFIGDAAMAVFGVPVAHDDDALRAVRAASDLRPALAQLNEELERAYGVTLSIRTGVNTGEVVVGDPSQGQAFATGDTVATAQRLEAAARAGEILIGDPTYRLVSNAVLVEPVDPLTLKGKAQPVTAWRLLGVVEGASPFPRRLDTPLIGREEELTRLEAELETAVRERRCRLATIVGPAGIGKSRLGNELIRRTAGTGTALVGRCLPYGEGVTYWPLRGIVLGAAGHLTADGIAARLDGAADAARVAPLVAGAVGAAEAPSGSEETFWAIRRFFEHLARDGPLVLGLDELQWAEPTFLDLVEYLVGWTTDAPIFLLGLGRPELGEKRPSWPITIALEPLSRADTERLTDLLSADLQPDERERITAAAEGNPLFLEQLLALAVEEGAREAIPPSIHALLTARLDRLEDAERAVLERAAVVGREFTRGAVAALSDEVNVGSTLLSLVRRDLIEPDRTTLPGEDGFRFRHVLIRDAAYLAIAKASRAELHQRYAEWLRRSAADLDELVGYHLEQAYRYAQELGPADAAVAAEAGEHLARAGRRAIRRGDLSAAIGLLTRAVALLPDGHTERHELLPILATALMRTGDFARAEEVLDDALAVAHAAGDQHLELRTLIEREFFREFTKPGESLEATIRVADSAIPLLEELGDDLGLAKAWWLRSEVHVNACRWSARAADLERALEHARRTGDANEQATLAFFLAQALYYGPMPVEEAIVRCEELLATRPDDRLMSASITGFIAGFHAMAGDFDEARRLHASARALYEELGQRFRIALRSLVAAEIEALAGQQDEATAILRWAVGELREMGVTSVMSTMAAFLADSLAHQGAYDEALEFAALSEETATPVDVVTQAMWRIARAKASGDAALAREAVELALPTDYPDLKARALLAAGQRARAMAEFEAKGNRAALARLAATPAPS
ncbi:MAG TPA: adenylate/guanylate cyclase domain-containing protein [Gaiellaceae bacterium]|nr:adenylate/guanylate cyclase domain-containing protein [Gaiellaceae bacterium]